MLNETIGFIIAGLLIILVPILIYIDIISVNIAKIIGVIIVLSIISIILRVFIYKITEIWRKL